MPVRGKVPEDGWSPEAEYARLMYAAGITLAVALAGSILAALPWPFFRSIGIIVVTTVAGGMGGAALGFLFGIPRILSDPTTQSLPAPPAAPPASASGASPAAAGTAGTPMAAASPQSTSSRRFLASNSNLEQVSDWLTKIILGVGLTQFYQLNSMLVRFQDLIRQYVPPADVVTPLITTIMLVFAIICGFLAMYLETRLVLSRIFNSVEEILADALKRNIQITAEKVSAENRASDLENAVRDIAADPTTTPSTLAAAADSLKSVATSDQASPGIRSIAAQALAATGRTSEANDLIPSGSKATLADQVSAMQVALYKQPPEGFQETLRIASEVSAVPEARASGDYWFFQAAALGQKHHYLLQNGGSNDELQSVRDKALDCVQRCLAIDSAYKVRVFWLLNPSKSPTPSDDDLSDFTDDPDFQKLAAPDPAPAASG